MVSSASTGMALARRDRGGICSTVPRPVTNWDPAQQLADKDFQRKGERPIGVSAMKKTRLGSPVVPFYRFCFGGGFPY